MGIIISSRVAIFAMIMCLIGAYYGNIKVGNGQCGGDIQGLVTQCAAYVQKPGPIADPSPACCFVLKSIDVACVCQHLSDKAKEFISMDKARHCLQFCGNPLPPGSKCGD